MSQDNDLFYKSIQDAFELLDKKREGIHYQKILDHIRISSYYSEFDIEKLKSKLLAYLGRCVSKKEYYERVPNGKSHKGKTSYKSGFYRTKFKKKEKDIINIVKPNDENSNTEQELDLFGQNASNKSKKNQQCKESVKQTVCSKDASTAHIGKGGEYAVMSELLYNGYYTSQSSVDDGVDIVAHKDKNVFFIQVKTTIVKNNSFDFRIKKDSFERYNRSGMFYIFVLRSLENQKAVSLYIIFPTSLIEHYYKGRYITSTKDEYNIKFRVQGTRVKLVGEKGIEQDITDTNLNQFDLIKP